MESKSSKVKTVDKIFKIVVIGPESTGKSTLCEKLAEHFNATYVPEYAREYLINNGTSYTIEDLSVIAAGQIKNEDEAILNISQTPSIKPQTINNKLLFIDTDLYVMKVWSEFVFDQCSNKILNGIIERHYDLYLLCEPDIPWVKDELREYPDHQTRERLFHHYKDILINQSCAWEIINGDYETRLQKAIDTVNKLFQ